jgi:hypothetical protein
MGRTRGPRPVTLVCGIIGRDGNIMERAQTRLTALYGDIDLASGPVPFDLTDYYSREMGNDLVRRFVSFAGLIDPGRLAEIKQQTNVVEQELGWNDGDRRIRRVNLDPGYVTPAKLVLATTKDFSHRIYLGQGIYAEVTLGFTRHGSKAFPWTYPDFAAGRYDAFLLKVRHKLLQTEAWTESRHGGLRDIDDHETR